MRNRSLLALPLVSIALFVGARHGDRDPELRVEPSTSIAVAVGTYAVTGTRTLRFVVERRADAGCARAARLEVIGPRGATLALHEFLGGACAIDAADGTLLVEPFTDAELQHACDAQRATPTRAVAETTLTTRMIDASARVLWRARTTIRAAITCIARDRSPR